MSSIEHDPNAAAERHAPDLTERQQRIMAAIRALHAEHGFAPSLREIGEACGLKSTSSVQHQLNVLESKGCIRRDPNKGRAIEVVDGSPTAVDVSPFPDAQSASFLASTDVPLVGAIAAGAPITAEQHVEDVMLEVHGDSMIDAAICNGDFVVVREQQTAENGDIVAALLDDEATVKTFRNENGHIWLIPHNPNYAPIDGTHAQIMGKVVTVLRKM